ncbi:hypothetical protein [Spirosoma foliorum]|uniref:Uncharacterized protein n=1 Tax=Spirosoma foliorum TaxID=2710596 RepID=A0A7G5H2K8_9BACT|nr:hypothetical protein [Spirosoma foliorum]QMW05350.1 hypothetical protein H3H32_10895 [Spirosoma foliorum]
MTPPVYTTGQVVVNSGSPISFTATDASGGNRTAVFTGLTLNAGPNTIRVRGSSNSSNTTPFFQNYITVARASSTSVVSGTTTTPPTQTTISSPYTNSAVLAGGFAEGSLSDLLAMAPFVPSTNQFGSWAYGNSAKTVTNDTITIGWHKGLGGSLTILKDGSGPNLINNNASITTTYQGQTRRENGRQSDWAGYGTPFGYNQNGGGDPYTAYSPILNAQQRDSGIGYNWVAGGSISQDTSRILHYETRTINWDGGLRQVTYFKTQPMQWELRGVVDSTYRHVFYWLKGREVKVMFIIQTFRTDGQQKFRGRLQEGPFMYITAPHYRYFVYTGTNPTGETGTTGLTQINLSSPCEGAGTAGCPNQNDTGNWTSTGNWIGALDESNNGVFIVTPYNSNFVGKQFQSRSGDENSNASAYITAGPHLQNIDLPGTNFLASASYYVGSLTSFRTWYNSAGIVKMPFSFSFTPGKTNGWWSENVSGKLNSDNRYEINIGGNGGQGRFYSPEGSWMANTIDTIYVRGRFYGASSMTMNLQWKRPGETEIQIAQFNNKTFTVQGDGVERTYAVRMNGVTNWSGMIAFVKLTNPYPYGSFTGNEKFIPTYIGKTNPN